VLADTPAELRDWRQTVPLAAALGALVGALLSPRGWAFGALAAAAACLDFAILFGAGHALIARDLAAFWPGLLGALAGLVGAGGVAAVALGGLAGWACGRDAPFSDRNA
jgi:hypothetical protein